MTATSDLFLSRRATISQSRSARSRAIHGALFKIDPEIAIRLDRVALDRSLDLASVDLDHRRYMEVADVPRLSWDDPLDENGAGRGALVDEDSLA